MVYNIISTLTLFAVIREILIIFPLHEMSVQFCRIVHIVDVYLLFLLLLVIMENWNNEKM